MDRHRILTRVALATLSVVVALSLGRLFAGGGWVLPLLGAALLPHVVGAICDRFHVPTALLFFFSLVLMVLFTAWVVAPNTTAFGAPTGATMRAIAEALRQGGTVLREAVPPVPANAAILAIAVPGVWIVALNADFLAMRADTPLGALVFPLILVVVTAIFERSAGSLVVAVAFAGTAALYLGASGSERLERRRAWLHTPDPAGRWRFAAGGIAIGVIAIAGAVVLGPLAPGANGERVADLRGLGKGDNESGDVTTDNPLVGLKGRLDQRPAATVFTVKADRPQYWRLVSLDKFDGKEWKLDGFAASGDNAARELQGNDNDERPRMTQVVTTERLTGQYLPAAFTAVSVRGVPDLRVVKGEQALLRTKGSGPITYTVESVLVPERTTFSDVLRATGRSSVPNALRPYLALPNNFPGTVDALARAKTDSGDGRFEKAQLLEDWFARSGEFTYSLETKAGSSGTDIGDFLRNKQGFCEQFAAAYAAMARAVGIPARVAVGFTPGEATADGYTVRTKDAHAWAEVWISNEVGWIAMEPTPAGSQPGQPPGPDDPNRPPPSPTTTIAPPTTLPTSSTVPPPTSSRASTSTTRGTNGPATTTVRGSRLGTDDGLSWVTVAVTVGAVALGALMVTLVVMARAIRRRRRGAPTSSAFVARLDRLLPGGRAERAPADAVHGAWIEALDTIGMTGFRARPTNTPHETAEHAPAPAGTEHSAALATLADVYTTAQFSPHAMTDEEVYVAWHAIDVLDAEVRAQTTRWQRLRGRLRLRSRRTR